MGYVTIFSKHNKRRGMMGAVKQGVVGEMRPFDLERALAGKPVVTRDGIPVEEIKLFKSMHNDRSLVYVADGHLKSCKPDGMVFSELPHENDLFMKSLKRNGWVNIYKYQSATCEDFFVSEIYPSREAAEISSAMDDETSDDVYLVDCIKIEWEE